MATKAKARTLGYHVLTDDWRISPWDCTDPGPLTVREAKTVWAAHHTHGDDCVIKVTACKKLSRLIDAPTVRVQAFQGDE